MRQIKSKVDWSLKISSVNQLLWPFPLPLFSKHSREHGNISRNLKNCPKVLWCLGINSQHRSTRHIGPSFVWQVASISPRHILPPASQRSRFTSPPHLLRPLPGIHPSGFSMKTLFILSPNRWSSALLPSLHYLWQGEQRFPPLHPNTAAMLRNLSLLLIQLTFSLDSVFPMDRDCI